MGGLSKGAGQKISTCLWYDRDAEEAASFYVSLFDDSRITGITRYGPNSPLPEGTVLTVTTVLAGTEYTLLNGGPHFTLTEASSIMVKCDDQAEIDRLWERLLEGGGTELQCFWLKDRFGLSWQVIPRRVMDMLTDPDAGKASRAFAAIMDMVKPDIAQLEAAYSGA